MKKKRRGWIAGLVVVLLVVVLPVTTFFALFFDPVRNAIHVDPDLQINERFNKIIVDSLENTTDSGDERVELVVTQADLNQLFYQVTSSAPNDVKKYLTQLDVVIDGDNYNFYFNVKFGFFKSRIILKTVISEDSVNNAFVFQIKDIAIARLKGLLSFTASIVSNFVTDEYIEELVGEYIHFDLSLAERKIVYPQSNLISDIQNLMSDTEFGGNSLYFSIISEFLEKDILNFDFDGQIAAKLKLTDLMTNDYIDGGCNLALTDVLDDAAVDTETKIESGTIDSSDNAAIKANFNTYFNANKGIPASDHPNVIMAGHIPDFSSYTLPDITNFKNGSDPTISYLTETELNGFLASLDFIGTTFIISDYSNETANVQYITIDNLYANFVSNTKGDFIYFGIGLNVNGCQTTVVFVTEHDETAPSSSSLISMKFITRQIYYGEILIFDSDETTISEASSVLVIGLFDLIASALQSVDTMSINKDDLSISVQFAFDAVVQEAINLISGIAPYGEAVTQFYADDQIDSNVGRLKIVWQND